jgi:RNA polymerase sigma-70 factor (ECF subfamily)
MPASKIVWRGKEVTVLQDECAVRLVLEGHVEAYSIIVDKYKNMIYDLCYKYTYDYIEAQDLSQDIFLKVYRKLDSFNSASSFSTWLYRVGINTCIDWARKNNKIRKLTSPDGDECFEYMPSQGQAPEDAAVDRERRALVRNAIMHLPEKYRTAVILYNFRDLSCSEISDILGLPVKTVETRLYRARKILKTTLLKPCNGGEYLWNAAK